MKVYVITSGEYSDYGIIGVMSSLEAAQEYVDKHKQADNSKINDLEEYELDAINPNDLELIDYWEATIFIRDGLIFKRYANHRGPGNNIEEEAKIHKVLIKKTPPVEELLEKQKEDSTKLFLCKYHPWVAEDLIHTISYKSQEHAVKLAVEARQKFL